MLLKPMQNQVVLFLSLLLFAIALSFRFITSGESPGFTFSSILISDWILASSSASLSVGYFLGAKFADSRAWAWPGYSLFILLSLFSSVSDVSWANRFVTLLVIALKVWFLWVLDLFRYLSCWPGFRWTLHLSSAVFFVPIKFHIEVGEWLSVVDRYVPFALSFTSGNFSICCIWHPCLECKL